MANIYIFLNEQNFKHIGSKTVKFFVQGFNLCLFNYQSLEKGPEHDQLHAKEKNKDLMFYEFFYPSGSILKECFNEINAWH